MCKRDMEGNGVEATGFITFVLYLSPVDTALVIADLLVHVQHSLLGHGVRKPGPHREISPLEARKHSVNTFMQRLLLLGPAQTQDRPKISAHKPLLRTQTSTLHTSPKYSQNNLSRPLNTRAMPRDNRPKEKTLSTAMFAQIEPVFGGCFNCASVSDERAQLKAQRKRDQLLVRTVWGSRVASQHGCPESDSHF
jgi:hypothetical protein